MKAIQINGSDDCQKEITRELEDLNEISSQFCANDLDHRIILKAYRVRLQHINETLAATEYTGLWDLITIFIEGVEALVNSGRELSNDECRFLLKFPNLLVEYFSLPLSKLPGKLLVRFFKNPEWVRPISDTEEDVIYNLICQQTDKVDNKLKKDSGFSVEDYEQEINSNENNVNEETSLDLSNVVTSNDINYDKLDTDTDVSTVDTNTLVESKINQEPEELVSDLSTMDSDKEVDVSLDFYQSSFTESEIAEQEEASSELGSTEIAPGQLTEASDDDMGGKEDTALEVDVADISISDISESTPGETIDIDIAGNNFSDEGVVLNISDFVTEEKSDAETVSITDLLSAESEDISENLMDESVEEPIQSFDLNSLMNEDRKSSELSFDETEQSEATQNNTILDLSEEVSDVSIERQTETEASVVDDDKCDIDENQQLLIDLVRAELAEAIDSRDDDIEALKNETDIEHKKHLLTNYSEQAENISHAVELIGLDGLSRSSEFISNNISHLSNMTDELTSDQFQLLHEWPVKLFAYLQDINNESASDQLAEFLNWESWPISANPEEIEEIVQQLKHPVLEEEEKIQRQTVASASDVTLELPEDVNQELLEGLLHDLPDQSEEFTGAIENLKLSGQKEDIEIAQRIAHTLKGAANVVGVKGIASLTHHLEDILEYLSNKNKQPTPALLEVLISASDCLEGMTESLLGIDKAPEDAVPVLQSVLDWANRLDNEGLPEDDGVTEAVTAAPVNLAEVIEDKSGEKQINEVKKSKDQNRATASGTSVSSDNVLRIPVNLADELLRIAGESLISNTQIEDKVNNSLKRQEVLAQHSSILQQISFDLEQLIDIQGITTNFTAVQDEEDFDALEMDKFHELHSVSRRLIEITSDSMQLSQTLRSELSELKNLVIDQDKLQKNNQDLVLRTRMVPVKSIIPRLKRGVRQVCRLTGKTVDLNIVDNDTYMDSEVLNEMIEPLMHILRNAVDHGIETVEERKDLNKNDHGTININCIRKGDQVVIDIEDDGKGLDHDLILNKAKSKNLVSVNQDMSDEAIYRLILEPGFSTRDDVTQTSGRGIGLDVVNNKLRSLKGSINIESPAGKGTLFQIILPISSFSTHSLMVRVRQYIYAISNRGVEEVLYPGSGELREVGNQLFYQLDDEAYETRVIDDLLNLPPDQRKIERDSRPVVIVKDDAGERHAILVQDVLDSRDVVVKSMGQYMPKIHGTIGATVLGDGSVAPVIDLPELLRDGHAQLQSVRSTQTSVDQSNRRVPYVLVVDDSLSARRSLAQFTDDLGMNTRTARDGMEAVSIIQSRVPDLILVDMEMPRMNGLELTAHVRADEKTRHVPIIMITSRSSDKHKTTALNKGVNHFVVKPFDEDLLASHINDLLEINE